MDGEHIWSCQKRSRGAKLSHACILAKADGKRKTRIQQIFDPACWHFLRSQKCAVSNEDIANVQTSPRVQASEERPFPVEIDTLLIGRARPVSSQLHSKSIEDTTGKYPEPQSTSHKQTSPSPQALGRFF